MRISTHSRTSKVRNPEFSPDANTLQLHFACGEQGGGGLSEQAARTLDALRSEGRRVTTARRLVVELLANTAEHLTADDLAIRIHDAHPAIHLSTVYRTLD